MYRILYNESIIFDPYGNENEVVTDASMSVQINAAAYLDFTMSRLHPLYNTIAERDGVVTLYWDQKILFQGVIESIDMDIHGNKSISCVSALDYLNDTVVRPYSTIAGEMELTAPSSVDGYFQWLIDQHNEHVLDAGKQFDVGVNQGANLKQNNFIYRSSTNNPTTASEISDKLLDSLGGYLTMRYVDDRRVLDLYADINTMNAQVIDFGINITDFNKTIDAKDQYTALLIKGGSPEFLGGGFEDGSFDNWVAHPNTPIDTSTVHSGMYSSFFTEGNGEYINSSFFYAKKGAWYKSTVWIKNERSSSIRTYPRYQVYENGNWVTKTIDGIYEVPNDGEWYEYSFEFMPNVDDYVKIRPRWVFDTVANDNNKRVYVDDFNFRKVAGDTEVAEDPISLSMVPDGGVLYDDNIVKTGDVIYDQTAVTRYGYKEKVYEDSTITDVNDLLRAGVKELNRLKDPQIGLDIKAVDLALFMEGYTHLNVGDAVRVRSSIHDTDEFLIVNSITLDLQDPGQSEYNIGKAYDSLTGQQSGFLRSLNSGINSSLDAVASLDQTTKDQAVKIGSVTNVANKAQETANSASSKADNAQKSANNAHAAANAAQSKADSVGNDLDTFRTETNTTVQNVRDSVSKTQSDVDAVTKKASDLSDDLDATKATVSQTVTELGEVKTTVTNAASKADQSLQVSTQASQTATSASQTATSAYNDAQTALSQSSEAVQTANKVSLSLKTDYQTKADADAKYATQSSLTATSDQIKSEVSKTYATKATVDALENIANNAVQTWMGTGAPTLNNKPASDWNTATLKAQHSGDIYYDTDTGYSYRFGSSDGSTYSWALIKDTDISKAIADAAKAQKTADSATSGVSELKSSIPVTYATKTELTQKADSITSRVEEVAQAGTTTSNKVTQLEQTASGLQSTVNEQSRKLDQQATTISQVSQKADSISTSLIRTNENLDALSLNMIKNPGFETGDFTNWSHTDLSKINQLCVNSENPLSGTYKAEIWFPSSEDFYLSANPMSSVAKYHTYEISCWIWSDEDVTIRLGFQTDAWDSTNQLSVSRSTAWQRISTTCKFQKNYSNVTPRIVFPGPIHYPFRVRLDNFDVRDITEGVEASGTANSALSKASTLEQNLDGFKTTVSQTYATKTEVKQTSDSLTVSIKQSLGVANAAASSVLVKNGDFESNSTEGWSFTGFSSPYVNSSLPYTGTYKLVAPISGSGSHAMVNDAIIPVYQGQKFRFRCALYPDNTITNDLSIGFIGDNNALITSIVGSVTGGRWNTYSAVITVPSGVKSMRARIATNNNSFKNLRVDSITVTDVTDGANAQSTANTASSNAANAQNRVGNLETCIKMTTDGVRVGKISNGNFSGYSALVNSAGSFDVLDGSSKTIAKFSQYGLDVSAGDSESMFIGMIPGTTSYGYIGSTPSFGSHSGMDLHSGITMGFGTGKSLNLVNDFGSINIDADDRINLLAKKGYVTINGVDVRGAGVVLFDKDDGNNYASVDIPSQYDFGYFNYIMCFFKTNDGQYFGGTAYHPNGKTYNFTTMGGSTDMSYIKGTQWAFNGTKATRKMSFEIGPGYSTTVNHRIVHIVAILGFDFYTTKH